jgi:ketosteroid isomerase-like protein
MNEGMDTRPMAEIQGEREAMFPENMDAFMRRDFATIERSMRPDVVLELPGTSWLAGSYVGEGLQAGRVRVRSPHRIRRRT